MIDHDRSLCTIWNGQHTSSPPSSGNRAWAASGVASTAPATAKFAASWETWPHLGIDDESTHETADFGAQFMISFYMFLHVSTMVDLQRANIAILCHVSPVEKTLYGTQWAIPSLSSPWVKLQRQLPEAWSWVPRRRSAACKEGGHGGQQHEESRRASGWVGELSRIPSHSGSPCKWRKYSGMDRTW